MVEKDQQTKPPVEWTTIAEAFAKAVCEGDFVNFRLLLASFSPARQGSTESFDMPKYHYLLPGESTLEDGRYIEALDKVNEPGMREHIERELEADRPAQLPSELLMMLADNAVRRGKYTIAAQAYELLRVRAKMQQLFLDKANAALDGGDLPTAVRGYVISVGLSYDYAAFPEPLPAIPDYQTRALLLHADYPESPGASIGMFETAPFLQKAFEYLLSADAAGALSERPEGVRVEFLAEFVRQSDGQWDVFVGRYEAASALAAQFSERLRATAGDLTLAEEIERELGEDPRRIPATLLGRTIEGAEWWQYLKELAYEHPAAALFVTRQAVGDVEILMPRHRADSPAARILRLPDGMMAAPERELD